MTFRLLDPTIRRDARFRRAAQMGCARAPADPTFPMPKWSRTCSVREQAWVANIGGTRGPIDRAHPQPIISSEAES
eukprot:gene5230-9380_t